MTSNPEDRSQGKALGAGLDQLKPAAQSWVDLYLKEEENDGLVVDHFDKRNCMIISGPEGPKKGRRIVIPRDLSKYPDFPRNLGQYKTKEDFESAVVQYWRHRRNVQKNLKKKEKKQAITAKNQDTVGSGAGRSAAQVASHHADSDTRGSSHNPPKTGNGNHTKESWIIPSDLIVPVGRDPEIIEIRRKIAELCVDLLNDPNLIKDCR